MEPDHLFTALVRPDDLLALTFEFVNVALDRTQTPPQLVQVQPGQDAFLIVHFAPQHIGEASFTPSPNGLQFPPVAAALAGPSRLAFRIAPDVFPLPLAVATLLNWAKYQIQVAPNALPDLGIDSRVITDPAIIGNLPRPNAPAPVETAIELPYRVLLSPDASAVWAHSLSPVTSAEGLTELWHTRLSTPVGSNPSARAAVRAIWTSDLVPPPRPPWPPLPVIPTSPDPTARVDFVGQSSDFGLQISEAGPTFYVPRPVKVDQLILSALGGWLDANASWQFPSSDRFANTAWRHIAAMGRDQDVRIVRNGFLYPTGHRAAHLPITQRELAISLSESPPSGEVRRADYLVRRAHVLPLELEKDYAQVKTAYASAFGEGGEMPLRRLTLKTLATPELANDDPANPFLIQDGAGPIPFHFEGEDWKGNRVDFNLPLVFVPADADLAAIAKARGLFDGEMRNNEADLRGQSIAFANTSDDQGTTTLPTRALRFSAQDARQANPGDLTTGLKNGELPLGDAPFLPVLLQARVGVPAIDRFLGSSNAPGPQTIELSSTYLINGLVPGDAAKGVFASFVDAPTLAFPADKVGGLVNPSITVAGLSRELGPVPDLSNPTTLLSSLHGNLIGGITLQELLGVLDATHPPALGQIPRLTTTSTGASITTSFTWQPQVARINDPTDTKRIPGVPLVTTSNTKLTIIATATTSLSGADSVLDVTGRLENFALNFLPENPVVQVSFGQLFFHARNGSKVDLSVDGVAVEFLGALGFVNSLAELLPSDGFSNHPTLAVSPAGVIAGYTLGVPAAGAGVISLQDIAISATLELPFDQRPVALRLAFSDPSHQFIATVALVGGGGSFAVRINAQGVELIEGSIEFGGNITVGLGIVEANAHVMGGVFFHWDATNLYFTAYFRVGASVEFFGVVGISVDFYLGLKFTPTKLVPDAVLKKKMIENHIIGIIGGVATITVGVHVLLVTKSFSLTLERRFEIPTSFRLPVLGTVDPVGTVSKIPVVGSLATQLLAAAANDPTFDDTVTIDDWHTYCLAFAQEPA